MRSPIGARPGCRAALPLGCSPVDSMRAPPAAAISCACPFNFHTPDLCAAVISRRETTQSRSRYYYRRLLVDAVTFWSSTLTTHDDSSGADACGWATVRILSCRASAKASLLVSSYVRMYIHIAWNPVQAVGAWRGRFDSGGLLRIRAKRVLAWPMSVGVLCAGLAVSNALIYL
jgi:hypothetical protein